MNEMHAFIEACLIPLAVEAAELKRARYGYLEGDDQGDPMASLPCTGTNGEYFSRSHFGNYKKH